MISKGSNQLLKYSKSWSIPVMWLDSLRDLHLTIIRTAPSWWDIHNVPLTLWRSHVRMPSNLWVWSAMVSLATWASSFSHVSTCLSVESQGKMLLWSLINLWLILYKI
jgi:hypothetical protein